MSATATKAAPLRLIPFEEQRKAGVEEAGYRLIDALVTDPQTIELAADIRPSDFIQPDLAEIWQAAHRARLANEVADLPALIRHGADIDSVASLSSSSTTTLGWKKAVATLLEQRTYKRVQARLHQANEALGCGDLSRAVELMAAEADDTAAGRLGGAVTAFEICSNPPPTPAELIHGMLYRSGTAMLSGPSKSRKTYTFLDLAISVASGTPWLGFQTAPSPVLYLNLELAGHSLSRRLKAIAEAKGLALPTNLHILNLRGKMVTLETLRAELPRQIARTKAGLVIVDPYYRIAASAGAEENSNDAQTRVLSEIEGICTPAGASVVLGHHFAKGTASAKNSIDRAAGAGAMARWGDVIASLSEHEEVGAMVLEMSLRDFAPIEPIALRWEYPLWKRAGELDTSKLKKAPGRSDAHPAEALLSKLKDGMTAAEWRAASTWSEGTFRRKREDLLKSGQVILEMGCHRRKTP